MVMRLPPTVHGRGDRGFVPRLVDIARDGGVSAIIGDGANRWPAVHRADAARAYRLALERGEPGTRHHAVGEEGIAVRDLAGLIGRRLGVPTAARGREQAAGHIGFLAMFFGLDASASSALTRARLGWAPTGPGLLADTVEGDCFDGSRSKFSSG